MHPPSRLNASAASSEHVHHLVSMRLLRRLDEMVDMFGRGMLSRVDTNMHLLYVTSERYCMYKNVTEIHTSIKMLRICLPEVIEGIDEPIVLNVGVVFDYLPSRVMWSRA